MFNSLADFAVLKTEYNWVFLKLQHLLSIEPTLICLPSALCLSLSAHCFTKGWYSVPGISPGDSASCGSDLDIMPIPLWEEWDLVWWEFPTIAPGYQQVPQRGCQDADSFHLQNQRAKTSFHGSLACSPQCPMWSLVFLEGTGDGSGRTGVYNSS